MHSINGSWYDLSCFQSLFNTHTHTLIPAIFVVQVAFGADLRSIALFRVILGLTVIGDLLDRSWDIYAHYDDAGVLPRVAALEHFNSYWWLSIHMFSGKWWMVLGLFLVHAAVACSLILGYRSRLRLLSSSLLNSDLASMITAKNPILIPPPLPLPLPLPSSSLCFFALRSQCCNLLVSRTLPTEP